MILLMRHGETEHRDGFYGSTDSRLSEQGQASMQKCGQTIRFNAIACSPLQRCQQPAHILAEHHRCPCHILPELQEYHFGHWEGVRLDWLHQHHPEQLSAFWQTPDTFTPPGAEPFADFLARALHARSQILALHQQHPQLLVITHAGIIRALRLLAQQNTPQDWLTYPVGHASLHQLCPHSQQVSPHVPS